MFLIAAIGFYGIYVLLGLLRKMLSSGVIFNPYHPDKFGGIADFGRFGVKIAFYFSSGALVLPLAGEIIRDYGNNNAYLNLAAYALAGMFVVVMFASFLIPTFQVSHYVGPRKEALLLEARDELDMMIEEYRRSDDVNLKKGIEIGMYYYCNYKELLEIKDYPFDARVIMEFGLSFIIPLGVTVMQVYAG